MRSVRSGGDVQRARRRRVAAHRAPVSRSSSTAERLRRVRLLGLDIDGTLAGPHGMYPGADELLAECTAARLAVVLCSARPMGSLRHIAARHPCVGHAAALQGSYVCRVGERPAILASTTIDRAAALELAGRADGRRIEVWWYAGERWFATGRSSAVADEVRAVWTEPQVVDRFDDLPAPHKLLIVGVGSVDGATAARCAQLGLAWRRSRSADLEVISGAVSACKGLDAVADDLGLAAGEVAAAGDGANDEGMIAFAGTAFAFPPLAGRLAPGMATALPDPAAGGLDVLRRLIARR